MSTHREIAFLFLAAKTAFDLFPVTLAESFHFFFPSSKTLDSVLFFFLNFSSNISVLFKKKMLVRLAKRTF